MSSSAKLLREFDDAVRAADVVSARALRSKIAGESVRLSRLSRTDYAALAWAVRQAKAWKGVWKGGGPLAQDFKNRLRAAERTLRRIKP